VPTKRCMRARKLAALELAKWLRENLPPCYFGSPCVPLSARQMSRPPGVMVAMCPPVGPPGVTAAMCRPARCQGRYVSPCWPARCHGRHLSPVGPLGVTDAMCRSQVSRTPCVPCRPTTCQDRYVSPCRYARCHGCHVSFHQVSRPPCVGPPSITSAMCRSARCHGRMCPLSGSQAISLCLPTISLLLPLPFPCPRIRTRASQRYNMQ
jgi:hypothetical protein